MESLKMTAEWIRKDPIPVVLSAAGICHLISFAQICRFRREGWS